MEPEHGPATKFSIRVSFKHISGEVFRVRVVDRVHVDRRRVMIFGDGYSTATARFQPSTSTAAEEIHNYLIVLLVEAKAVLDF